MTPHKLEANRCVQLTETGLKRLHEARRRYRKTIEDIVFDEHTPSVNTVKRALRQGPVFLDTLERIWDYIRGCAQERKENFADLVRTEDYVYVDSAPAAAGRAAAPPVESLFRDNRWGWLSRSVPRANRLFTGRRDVLDILHTTHKEGSAALFPDAQALTGMGGVGKTQVAIAYVYEHRSYYNGIFWVNAESAETLKDGLAGLAEELNLVNGASAAKQDALQKMYDWFQQGSDWLLVLDNADDLARLAPHFPRHHNGSLLLTTRVRNTIQYAEAIEIGKFRAEEGALLLLRRAGLLNTRQALEDAAPGLKRDALDLSEELDGLPLAINQAAAYLSETGVSVPEYLAKYRQYGLALLDISEDPDHKSVTVTFRLALETLAKCAKAGPAAVELIRLCAFLSPDAIPEVIFHSYPFCVERPTSGRLSDPYLEVCAAACGYSLLNRDTKRKTLSIHRLTQKVVAETLSAEERQAWIERVVNAVSDASPDFEVEDWPACDLFLPQWRLCADNIRSGGIETARAANLLYQAGRYVRERALYDEAEDLLTRALQIAKKAHGENDPQIADYLDALGCLYRELDRTDEAAPLLTQALQIVEDTLGPEDPATGAKLHNIALFYYDRQDYAGAEASFVRALAIREKHLGADDPGVATTLTQLAGAYRCQEQFDKAERCYKRALEIYDSSLEPDHVALATGCNNLGLLYWTIGRQDEAAELFVRALKINEVSRGKDHPETAVVLWGLALVRWKQRRMEEAGELFRRAIAIYQKNFAPDHARLIRLCSYYADFQKDLEGSGR